MRAFHNLTPDETFIFHFRHDFPEIGDRWEPEKHSPRRAITVAIIVFGGVVYVGMAPCSWQDQFNRKIGYRMALGRALRQAGRMYDALGHHNSDNQYPFFDIDRQDEVDMKTKLQWARVFAEGINGGYRR